MNAKAIYSAALLVFCILLTKPASAAEAPPNGFQFIIGNTTYYENGKANTCDTAPYIAPDGRTMIQLSFLSKLLGFEVLWEETDRMIAISISPDSKLFMQVGDYTSPRMGVPEFVNGEIYVPLRLVARALNWSVFWDAALQSVSLSPPNPAKYFTDLTASVDPYETAYSYWLWLDDEYIEGDGVNVRLEREQMEKIVTLLTDGRLNPIQDITPADRTDFMWYEDHHDYWFYFHAFTHLSYSIRGYKDGGGFYDIYLSPDCTNVWVFHYASTNYEWLGLEDLMEFSVDATAAEEIKALLEESFGVFIDISADSEHAEPVEALAKMDILKGYPDRTFQPQKYITRAEIVAMSLRIQGYEEEARNNWGVLSYADVPGSSWASGYIRSGSGILHEVENGYFRPDGSVTYEQALRIFTEAAKYHDEAANLKGDAALHLLYTADGCGYSRLADALGISLTVNKENDDFITRAEAAQIAWGFINGRPVLSEPFEGTYIEDIKVIRLYPVVAGADIFYTLDRTEPDVNSTKFAGTIPISQTLKIRAIAVKNNVIMGSDIINFEITDTMQDTSNLIPREPPSANFQVSIDSAGAVTVDENHYRVSIWPVNDLSGSITGKTEIQRIWLEIRLGARIILDTEIEPALFWRYPSIPLAVGKNEITVTAEGSDGETASQTVVFEKIYADDSPPITRLEAVDLLVHAVTRDIPWEDVYVDDGNGGYDLAMGDRKRYAMYYALFPHLDAPGFSDISNLDKRDRIALALAANADIIDGFEDGTFRPEEKTTYAQAIKMALCALTLGNGFEGLKYPIDGDAYRQYVMDCFLNEGRPLGYGEPYELSGLIETDDYKALMETMIRYSYRNSPITGNWHLKPQTAFECVKNFAQNAWVPYYQYPYLSRAYVENNAIKRGVPLPILDAEYRSFYMNKITPISDTRFEIKFYGNYSEDEVNTYFYYADASLINGEYKISNISRKP